LNNSVININGIHANQRIITGEHTTDTSALLTIKDEYGNEIEIIIVNGKICSSKHKQ
jgi:hypothetical protein